jgi:hypothetical protein
MPDGLTNVNTVFDVKPPPMKVMVWLYPLLTAAGEMLVSPKLTLAAWMVYGAGVEARVWA